MSIATLRVVPDDDVHLLPVQQCEGALDRRIEGHLDEAPCHIPPQPGVGEAEGVHRVYAQDGRGIRQLPSARCGQIAPEVRSGETCGPVGGGDEDDSMALGDRPGHRPRGEQGLIIGVSVQEHEGRHLGILAHPSRSVSSRADRPHLRLLRPPNRWH